MIYLVAGNKETYDKARRLTDMPQPKTKFIGSFLKITIAKNDNTIQHIEKYSHIKPDELQYEILSSNFLDLPEVKVPTHKEIIDNWWLTSVGNWEKVTAYNPTERAKGDHNHCYRLDGSGWSSTSSFTGMESAEFPPVGVLEQ